ncbi:MAG TPA: metalloregulator ArsR/SmtB family transcription factor [Vicinamibacteria bacterium]|nr:metalloregulator ArsR/SmtB family transcription factor [Vicinamibacteria bacterium]
MNDKSPDSIESAVILLKALADATRLRMVGLMVDRGRSGQELASILGVSPPTISHHLQVLRKAGLLKEERDSPYTFYTVELSTLQRGIRQVTDKKRVRRFAERVGLPEDKRRVLGNFFHGSRLLQIPAQRRKQEIVLEEILRRLPRRNVYEERQLSRWLEAIHEDYASLRRGFIDGRYMERSRGQYTLTDRGRAALAEG